jgi:hypothetical protein
MLTACLLLYALKKLFGTEMNKGNYLYLEMPKFTKTEDELETMFDKWMFVPGFPRNRESVVYTRKAPQNGEPFLLSSQLQVRITLCQRHAVTHC